MHRHHTTHHFFPLLQGTQSSLTPYREEELPPREIPKLISPEFSDSSQGLTVTVIVTGVGGGEFTLVLV